MVKNSRVPIIFSAIFQPEFANRSQEQLPMILTESGQLFSDFIGLIPRLTKNLALVVDYLRKEMNLLPPPFATRCRDYAGQGLNSQEDCLRECLLRKSLKTNHSIPSGYPYTKVDDIKMSIPSGTDSLTLDENFDHDCESQCNQIACRIVTYRTRKMGLIATAEKTTALAIQLPAESGTRVNYRPKMTLTEYGALLGSIFGVWLGLSFFSLLDVMIFIGRP